MPPRREPLLVLHIVGQYPMAGVALAGGPLPARASRRSAGTSTTSRTPARRPYDPTRGRRDRRVQLRGALRRRRHAARRPRRPLGLPRHVRNETHGLSRARLDELYRDRGGDREPVRRHGAARRAPAGRAAASTSRPTRSTSRSGSRRASVVDRVPGRSTTCSSPTARTSGSPDCPVPLEPFAWKTTRPPVVLELLGAAARIPRRASSRRSRRWRTRARTSPGRARPTSGRSTSTSSASSTCRAAPRSAFQLAMKPRRPPRSRARVRAAGWYARRSRSRPRATSTPTARSSSSRAASSRWRRTSTCGRAAAGSATAASATWRPDSRW